MGKILVIGNTDFSNVAVKKVDFLKGTYIKITPTFEGADSLVSGDGFYAIGKTATISAASNNIYNFVKWSDGITDSVRTITVTNEGTLYLYAEYELIYNNNDFIWGNGGIMAGIGTTSGSLNAAASTAVKLIHTLSECNFAINQVYISDFIIRAYGCVARQVHVNDVYQEDEYINNYDQPKLTIPSNRYVQVCIKNIKNVNFTSDLSLCSEILLVGGEYELTK